MPQKEAVELGHVQQTLLASLMCAILDGNDEYLENYTTDVSERRYFLSTIGCGRCRDLFPRAGMVRLPGKRTQNAAYAITDAIGALN